MELSSSVDLTVIKPGDIDIYLRECGGHPNIEKVDRKRVTCVGVFNAGDVVACYVAPFDQACYQWSKYYKLTVYDPPNQRILNRINQ